MTLQMLNKLRSDKQRVIPHNLQLGQISVLSSRQCRGAGRSGLPQRELAAEKTPAWQSSALTGRVLSPHPGRAGMVMGPSDGPVVIRWAGDGATSTTGLGSGQEFWRRWWGHHSLPVHSAPPESEVAWRMGRCISEATLHFLVRQMF